MIFLSWLRAMIEQLAASKKLIKRAAVKERGTIFKNYTDILYINKPNSFIGIILRHFFFLLCSFICISLIASWNPILPSIRWDYERAIPFSRVKKKRDTCDLIKSWNMTTKQWQLSTLLAKSSDTNLPFHVVYREYLSRTLGCILSRWPHMSLPGLQFAHHTTWRYLEI